MKNIFLRGSILLFSFGVFLNCNGTPFDTFVSTEQNLFQEIEKTYNLKVHYKYSSDFFPEFWKTPPISGYGTQIDTADLPRLKSIMETFLSGYSAEFLRENLQDIYLLKDMYFYEKRFGGTSHNVRKAIYITNDGYSDIYLLGRFHSEFSSILFNNYSDTFPSNDWKAINPIDFEYVGSGVSVLGQGDLFGQTSALLNDGFLVKYSMSTMENDFNMLVDWLFTRPEALMKLTNTYEKINEKLLLVKEFYDEIDAGVSF